MEAVGKKLGLQPRSLQPSVAPSANKLEDKCSICLFCLFNSTNLFAQSSRQKGIEHKPSVTKAVPLRVEGQESLVADRGDGKQAFAP